MELLFYAHYCKLYGIASCLLETEKADRLAVVICCKKRLLGTLFNIALAALLYLEPFCQTFEYEPNKGVKKDDGIKNDVISRADYVVDSMSTLLG